MLREAYARFPPDAEPTWTDEAALLEACRIPVHVVPGDPSNLKVTRPADLGRVEASLVGGRVWRTGLGVDAHPFGPGEPLALGGILIDGVPRLHGHSDGDVALHAVGSALLGAAGLGDLGRLFPAGPETPSGIASGAMLAEILRQVDGRRLARRERRPHDHGRAAAARAAPGRHARGDRGDCSASPSPRRTSRPRRGTSSARRAPAGPSPRSPWPPWSATDDRPAPRHAHGRHPRLHPAGRRRRHLLVRSDGLRAGPHRQLPVVPVRRPARPAPALARSAGPLGHERHGRRRQDHPGRRRSRDRDRRAHGAPPVGLPRRGRDPADDDARRHASCN